MVAGLRVFSASEITFACSSAMTLSESADISPERISAIFLVQNVLKSLSRALSDECCGRAGVFVPTKKIVSSLKSCFLITNTELKLIHHTHYTVGGKCI